MEPKPNKITVAEAAKMMGVTPRFLQLTLQREKVPFGHAIEGNGRWMYYINRTRFMRYMRGEDMIGVVVNDNNDKSQSSPRI